MSSRLKMIDAIAEATEGRGIYVLDRGGDCSRLYHPLPERDLHFIIRLVGNRHLLWKGALAQRALALPRDRYALCRDSGAGERRTRKKCHLEYGFRRVKLPRCSKKELTLVVIKGFGEEALLLLTSVAVKKSRQSLWRIVSG